jgi:uncharacterized transporter YbjL
MRDRVAPLDVAIAAGAALVLTVVSPGLAIVGLVALLAVALCLISFLLERLVLRGSRRQRRRGR